LLGEDHLSQHLKELGVRLFLNPKA